MAGHKNGQATRLYDDNFLATTVGMDKITIRIKSDVEDAGNTGNTSLLRQGLVLVPLITGANAGEYVVFVPGAATDGSAYEEDAVVLGQEINMADYPGDVRSAMAYHAGCFWYDTVFAHEDFDFGACQRIRRLRRF